MKPYILLAIKMCHFIFDNNFLVYCSVFLLSVPLEKGMHTLQYAQLMDCHVAVIENFGKLCSADVPYV